MEIIQSILDQIDIVLLVFARVIGIFVAAPVFSHNNIPPHIKIGFSFIVSLVIFPFVQVPQNFIIGSFYSLLFISFKEIVTGLMIGFVCYLFFSCIYLVGSIIDMQIGFSMAEVMNPQDDTQIPLMGNLFYIMAILIFLSMNGHHTLIYALKYSFTSVPLNSLVIHESMIEKIIEIMRSTFIIAFKMSAPILVTVFICNVVLGVLARTMPQMNVFIVGMPMKIFVGLLMILLMMPLYVGFFENIFTHMFENLYSFLNLVIRG
ncbi:flagellar biosynthetic protein FliR [Anaerophilus nitritogenes]|uniref:flagellar biosynthetic protein FliR n=1 Tax=Anaerophilus nitritogenes TaxID=2498136 RepID=UPI0013ECDD51|nr:flagellar biosynthetic protein FliR [Anaerophilus nitritogenes]